MIDYLNPHRIYPDAQNQPDLNQYLPKPVSGLEVADLKICEARIGNIEIIDLIPGKETSDAERGAEIMDNRINSLYGAPDETPAERIIRLYRSGMSHVDITQRGFDLADVRRVISEATAKDETLYQTHKGIEIRWSKRSATGGEQ